MEDKKRLDIILIEKGLTSSRERAKELIQAQQVLVNGKPAQKPAQLCALTDTVELCGEVMPYVGRGGLKLEKALDVFGVDPAGCCAVDIGASTGGFTHCLLLRGARKVYAVDVGTDQLHETLRHDTRVCNMENRNIRYLTVYDFPELPTLAVCDVSFISLRLVLPVVRQILAPDGVMLTLIKPQFEAGKSAVGKKGVVKDPKVHIKVLQEMQELIAENGFVLSGMTYSPIRGPEGNIEFLAYLRRHGTPRSIDIPALVAQAHTL